MNKRSYQQFCGLALALDTVGERWTLLIVRNLLLGPKRYGELQAELPGITTNLLAKRLKEMEAGGLLCKRERRYALSERGLELEPVVLALGRFGAGLMVDGPGAGATAGFHVNIGWAMVAMKRRYQGTRTGRAWLGVDGRGFLFTYGPDGVYVEERTIPIEEPAFSDLLHIEGPLDALQPWLFGGQSAAGFHISGPDFSGFCASFGLADQPKTNTPQAAFTRAQGVRRGDD